MKTQAEIVNCRLGFIFLIFHHKIDRVILLIGILVIDREISFIVYPKYWYKK